MKMPEYDFDPETRTGTLTGEFDYETDVLGISVDTDYVDVSPDGTIVLRVGYHWNFGDFPAIDTPEMVAASLVHDGFCDLIKYKVIDKKYRAPADKFFRKMLKAYGVGWARRTWCYAGVRIGAKT